MTSTSRILVIEDDLAIRKLLMDLVRDEGYEVRGAADGAAGLEQLDWPPDLILLDLMMPVMDGPTFLARKRETPRSSDLPVIVITARGDAENGLETMGVSERIAKPFDNGQLLASIASVLDGSRKSLVPSD